MCSVFVICNVGELFAARSTALVQAAFDKGRSRFPAVVSCPSPCSSLYSTPCSSASNSSRLYCADNDGGMLFQGGHVQLCMDGVELMCDGEIYNYRELLFDMGISSLSTGNDCEVIVHLYRRYGIDQTLAMLDGVFSLVLHDRAKQLLFVARDPLGVRPLYSLVSPIFVGFASELKMLHPFHQQSGGLTAVRAFPPGHVVSLRKGGHLDTHHSSEDHLWRKVSERCYFTLAQPTMVVRDVFAVGATTVPNYLQDIRVLLTSAVQKRCGGTEPRRRSEEMEEQIEAQYHEQYQEHKADVADTEEDHFHTRSSSSSSSFRSVSTVACLLSGGLDSSLVAALAAQQRARGNGVVNGVVNGSRSSPPPPLRTFCIGLEGGESEDVRCAELVAAHIQSQHTTVLVTEAAMVEAIPRVIAAIESFDVTTVRASLGHFLLAEHIAQKHPEVRSVLTGDGADELFGGYLYFHRCRDSIQFDQECRRLLREMHHFDLLRADKCLAAHGLQLRAPFLDQVLVQSVLSMPARARNWTAFATGRMEKQVLRHSFVHAKDHDDQRPLLPNSILFRRKEAFSDGVSGKTRSLYVVLQEHIARHYDQLHPRDAPHSPCVELEKRYYRECFDTLYTRCAADIVPHQWMPRFGAEQETSDPSARTLAVYHSEDTMDVSYESPVSPPRIRI